MKKTDKQRAADVHRLRKLGVNMWDSPIKVGALNGEIHFTNNYGLRFFHDAKNTNKSLTWDVQIRYKKKEVFGGGTVMTQKSTRDVISLITAVQNF